MHSVERNGRLYLATRLRFYAYLGTPVYIAAFARFPDIKYKSNKTVSCEDFLDARTIEPFSGSRQFLPLRMLGSGLKVVHHFVQDAREFPKGIFMSGTLRRRRAMPMTSHGRHPGHDTPAPPALAGLSLPPQHPGLVVPTG